MEFRGCPRLVLVVMVLLLGPPTPWSCAEPAGEPVTSMLDLWKEARRKVRFSRLESRDRSRVESPDASPATGSAEEEPLLAYALEVQAQLGPIPSFDPFKAGKFIPVTLDGVEVTPGAGEWAPACDRPPLLSGMDWPNSIVGRLVGINPATGRFDPDIQWGFTLRHDWRPTGARDPHFNDVAIIGHHRKTGATAFFQSLSTGAGRDCTRVPSPMERTADTPAGQTLAKEFWIPPAEIAEMKCVKCHDADPFIHTPYLDQVTITGPDGKTEPIIPQTSGPREPYTFIGEAFRSWGPRRHFNIPGNKCTTCHRIGTSAFSSRLVSTLCGRMSPPRASEQAKQYPASHVQPAGVSAKLTHAQWDKAYSASVDQLLDCMRDPTQAKCHTEDVPTGPGSESAQAAPAHETSISGERGVGRNP